MHYMEVVKGTQEAGEKNLFFFFHNEKGWGQKKGKGGGGGGGAGEEECSLGRNRVKHNHLIISDGRLSR